MAEQFVNAVADTFIKDSQPDVNYGSLTNLTLKKDLSEPIRTYVYIKFNVPDLLIDFVYLRLLLRRVYDGEQGPMWVTASGYSSWAENSLTFNNASVKAGTLISTESLAIGGSRWLNIDITEQAKKFKGGVMTMILIPAADKTDIYFDSRETSNPPNLRIIYTEAPPPPTTGGIVGVVTDSVTGAQLSGASVSGDPGIVITSSDGSYSFQNLIPDQYTYEIAKSGYTTQVVSVMVIAGASATRNIALVPVYIPPPPPETGWIEGHVYDYTTGLVIEGANIILDGFSTSSDHAGFFTIGDLPVGDYTLTCAKSNYETEATGVPIYAGVSTVLSIALVPSYIPPGEGWLAQAKRFILETLPAWIVSIPKAIADTLDNAFNISYIFNTTVPNAIQEAKDYSYYLFESLQTIIPQWIINAANWVVSYGSAVWNWINTKSSAVWNWIDNYSSYVLNWISTKSSMVWNWINTKSSLVWDWIENKSSAVWDWIENYSSDVWNWIQGAGVDAVNWVNSAGIELYNDFQDFKAKIVDYVESAIFYILDNSIEKEEDIREEFRKGMP